VKIENKFSLNPHTKFLVVGVKIKKIEDSIDRAINFLYQNQLPWGEFKTLVSWNFRMLGSSFDSSPFATALALYCLKDIKNEKARIMTEKAIGFLLDEQEKGGIWRFWTKRNKKRIPPDLDDISTISFILKMNGVNFDDNLQLILNNRNKDNLFLTWIVKEGELDNLPWFLRKEWFLNDVDWVVNTNILLYLDQNDAQVCSFVNEAVKSNKFRSLYYPSRLAFFYMISRAFKNNITSLGENRDIIIQSTLNEQKRNGSFDNSLETALALNTLFNFNYDGKEIDFGINFLLQRQSINGFWKREVLFLGVFPYRHYGSEELTTALCLESLKNYQQMLKNGKNI